jgi:hypothetical protein
LANKLGWVVAGALAVGVLTVVTAVALLPSATKPTLATTRAGVLDFHDTGVAVADVLGAEPADRGNAADDYVKAARKLKANWQAVKAAGESVRHPAPAVLALLEEVHADVARGATKREMRFVVEHSGEEFEVAPIFEPAGDLEKVGWALTAVLAGHYADSRQYAKAERALRHAFAMGRHMMNERARVDAVLRGLRLQQRAIRQLQGLYTRWGGGHGQRLPRLRAYASGLERVSSAFRGKWVVVWTATPEPGDVFNIIENDKDRAWRVDALLGLSIVKIRERSHRGNSRKVRQLIDRFLRSSDPLERCAARAAERFTRADFDKLGYKSP